MRAADRTAFSVAWPPSFAATAAIMVRGGQELTGSRLYARFFAESGPGREPLAAAIEGGEPTGHAFETATYVGAFENADDDWMTGA